MSSDPVIDEMHRIKDALSAEFNHEVHLLFEHLLRVQKTSGRDYVSFAPQIIQEEVPVVAESDDSK